ncbi:MAG: hypothetical protein PHD68_02170 [Rugosibacter sp.]|nr:hypothetical protein [Rugosibacter sp.]
MSNLLNTDAGRMAVMECQKHQLKERMSRFFHRTIEIDFSNYKYGISEFDLGTMLGALNTAWDQDIQDMYNLLATIGGLPSTIANVEINVDPVNGSDVTGTGSAVRPYASLWFLPTFAKTEINHLVRILIHSDIVHGALNVTNSFGPTGCLSFIGVGAETEVLAGLAGTIVANTNQQQAAWEITPSIACPTTICKAFIQMQSGVDNLKATPILRSKQALPAFWMRHYPMAGIAPLDAYRFIQPARALSVTSLDVDTVGSRKVNDINSWRTSKVNFCNLRITIAIASQGNNFVSLRGLPVGMWFCQMSVISGLEYPIHIETDLNEYAPIDGFLHSESGVSVSNLNQVYAPLEQSHIGLSARGNACGLQIINPAADEFPVPPSNQDHIIAIAGNPRIASVDCMSQWYCDQANAVIHQCGAQGIKAYRSSLYTGVDVIDPNEGVFSVGIDAYHSQIDMFSNLHGTSLSSTRQMNSRANLDAGGGDSTTNLTATSYNHTLRANSALYISSAWTGTTGSINNIAFTDTNPDTLAAYPAVNAMQTDALNNNVSRGDV